MTVETAAAASEGPGRAAVAWRRLQGPPGWIFHAVLVAECLLVLWALSFPGSELLSFLAAVWIGIVLVVVWFARLVVWLARRRRVPGLRVGWWFLVAPAMGLVVVMLDPLQLRWDLGEEDFDEVVATLERDGASAGDRSGHIGWYDISSVIKVGEDSYLFYERNGNLSDDAGFAYLPDGPDGDLENGGVERPRFRHLGGDWYTFNASW